jgi:hypothetical protein
MGLVYLLLLIACISGLSAWITGSLGLVLAQSGLPPSSEVRPIPNGTIVARNESQSNPAPNTLQPIPEAPFK